MRLDHLLSREYKKKDRRDHGAGSGRIESERGKGNEVLYSFERARERNVQGKKEGRRPGHRGGVAQLGEHLLCKQGVIGSNPFISTRPCKEEAGERESGRKPEERGLIAQQVRAHA